MIWRFVPGFNDNYMMTETGEVKHLMSSKVLEQLPITIHGEPGVLMRNSDLFWRLVPVNDLLCATYPELHKKAVEHAVLCANCKETIYQLLETGRWYHKKGVTACRDSMTHAEPGETWDLA